MLRRTFVLGLAMAALTACGVSSSEPRPNIPRSYELVSFNFSAEPGITVSEAAGLYPSADVVWRGDPFGNRITQIESMFREAAQRNFNNMGGSQRVVLDVTLVRFHGVTERTQFSFGGVHNIVFMMAVRDAATGAVIEGPRRVVANLDQPGGQAAVDLENSGQTQRVRVVNHLASVIRSELQN
jgi:hypothetical protein